MKFLDRKISNLLLESFKKYPVVTVTGPRQSGKSTLIKKLFGDLPYVNLESLNTRNLAKEDPSGFLNIYQNGLIIDEVQNVPELFSEIQVIADKKARNSLFVLSGSQNFSLIENISQTLAGRTALFNLYPFSFEELKLNAPNSLEKRIFYGGYPRIFKENLEPRDWLDNYIQTFVEKDIRALRNISNLSQFRTFIKMCAARSGHNLDLVSLGNDCGISSNTAKAWISLLETSFVVFKLNPFYKNFNKRLIKSPKLYFWDTGLLCYLLGLQSYEELFTHASRGHIFETYIISELKKYINNTNAKKEMFFWKDKASEIDCLIEINSKKRAIIEIKSASTFNASFLKGIKYFSELSIDKELTKHVIYAGDEEQILNKDINLHSEKEILQNINKIID